MRLSPINQKFSSAKARWVLAAGIFLVGLLVYIIPSVRNGMLGLPPAPGDQPAYDMIGLQLSQGKGFSRDWDDQEYKAPYVEHNGTGMYTNLLARSGASPATNRPPLLPIVIAASHSVFGRRFEPIRIFTAACMALACAGAFLLLSRTFGVFPGLLCAAWFLLDPRTRFYAVAILTEAQTCLAVVLVLYALVRTVETSDWWAAVGLGVASGLAYLSRSMFFLWLPVICIAVYFLARPREAPWLSREALRKPLFLITGFMVVASPWMVRNCLVLDRFEPLGTMGGINLPTAYSDTSLQRRGQWFSLKTSGLYDHLDLEGRPLLEQEKMMADEGKSIALHWIRENPLTVAFLAAHKARSLWIPSGPMQGSLLVLAIAGFAVYFCMRRREALCILVLLGACTLAVAGTWTVGGRFIVPVLPLLAMLAGLGTWCVLVLLAERRLPRVLTPDEGGASAA